jgi:hypothetical protein
VIIIVYTAAARRGRPLSHIKEITTMNKHYVLYIEHDTREHDVSVHATWKEAEAALMKFAEDYFDGHSYRPSKCELVQWLMEEHGECARIYKCKADGTSRELVPFLREEEMVP